MSTTRSSIRKAGWRIAELALEVLGGRPPETIHGQATPDEAAALFEEGVPVAPLPFPVAPPEDIN